jgi:hypothetical protein
MRKILVAGLLLGTTALWAGTCELVLALQGLEASGALAPPSPVAVRAAMERQRAGQFSSVAIERLRRTVWEPGEPLAPVRWRIGPFGGEFTEPPRRRSIRIQLPPPLLGTVVELLVAVHEHQHARVSRALPALEPHEEALLDRLDDDPNRPDADRLLDELAELSFWNERFAMAGEWAVLSALTVEERAQLDAFLRGLPETVLDEFDREFLLAGVRDAGQSFETYLLGQYAVGRYTLEDCRDQFADDLEELREELDEEAELPRRAALRQPGRGPRGS